MYCTWEQIPITMTCTRLSTSYKREGSWCTNLIRQTALPTSMECLDDIYDVINISKECIGPITTSQPAWVYIKVAGAIILHFALKKTIACSRWVEHLNNTYNSHITYATNTKLATLTAHDDPAIILQACSCKPSVTKLASALHTLLWPPQLCSLWV